MLWYEAVDQLKAGRTLRATARALWARAGSEVRVMADPAGDGWLIVGGPRSAPRVLATLERLEMALLEFERRVGQIGLISAVAANRYAFLFPNGSSLGWRPLATSAWRPRAMAIRLPRLRRAG